MTFKTNKVDYKKIPSYQDLSGAYDCLLKSENLDDERWALYAQWIRFDPRLGELMFKHLLKFWKQLNPLRLREAVLGMRDPQVFGVLCEQLACFAEWSHKEEKKLFQAWAKTLMTNIGPHSFAQFYVGISSPASPSMLKNAQFPLRVYKKWGFAGRDVWVNKWVNKQQSVLDKESRTQILNELIGEKQKNKLSFLRVSDYLKAVDHLISHRVAELDLGQHPKLKAQGQTRSRVYMIVS